MTAQTRTSVSDAVEDLGWRLILGFLCTSVPVGSLAEAQTVAVTAISAAATTKESALLASSTLCSAR